MDGGSVESQLAAVSSIAIDEMDPGVAVSSDYRCAYIAYTQRKVNWTKIKWRSDGASTYRPVDVPSDFGGGDSQRLI